MLVVTWNTNTHAERPPPSDASMYQQPYCIKHILSFYFSLAQHWLVRTVMQLARNAHTASRTPDHCIADVLIVHIVHSTPNRSPRVQANFCSALDGCVLVSPAEGAEANLLLAKTSKARGGALGEFNSDSYVAMVFIYTGKKHSCWNWRESVCVKFFLFYILFFFY